MNKLLYNQTFWRVIWTYTLILYLYFFGTLFLTGEEPVIINEIFTNYLYITSGILITPLMIWGAFNQFRTSRKKKA